MASADEGRLSRWSRLKRKGGASAAEEMRADSVTEAKADAATGRGSAAPALDTVVASALPGGILERAVVAPMPALGGIEDDDDDLTRGIGHETEEEAAATEAVEEDKAVEADEPPELASRPLSDEEQALVDEMPDLESMNRDSDFTPFLTDGVPDFIRRRAMRRLWMLDPMFNFRDGLNDYDDDFNVLHKIIDAATGNYQVGRGHLSEKELEDMTPEEARRAFAPEDEEKSGDVAVDGGEMEADEGGEGEEPVLAEATADVRPPDDAVNVRQPISRVSETEDDAEEGLEWQSPAARDALADADADADDDDDDIGDAEGEY